MKKLLLHLQDNLQFYNMGMVALEFGISARYLVTLLELAQTEDNLTPEDLTPTVYQKMMLFGQRMGILFQFAEKEYDVVPLLASTSVNLNFGVTTEEKLVEFAKPELTHHLVIELINSNLVELTKPTLTRLGNWEVKAGLLALRRK